MDRECACLWKCDNFVAISGKGVECQGGRHIHHDRGKALGPGWPAAQTASATRRGVTLTVPGRDDRHLQEHAVAARDRAASPLASRAAASSKSSPARSTSWSPWTLAHAAAQSRVALEFGLAAKLHGPCDGWDSGNPPNSLTSWSSGATAEDFAPAQGWQPLFGKLTGFQRRTHRGRGAARAWLAEGLINEPKYRDQGAALDERVCAT